MQDEHRELQQRSTEAQLRTHELQTRLASIADAGLQCAEVRGG